MDVKTVCLGMLSDGEASGYDLKKEFQSSFGHFFAAGYGSIYPALSSLAEDGLVDCVQIPQEGKPDRKVYSITDKGREQLLAALDNPSPSHKIRSEFLATMCFAHLMTDAQVNTVIESRLNETRKYLKLFHELETTCCDDWYQGEKFVLGFGKAVASTILEYIEKNRHMLSEPDSVSERRTATA